MEEPTLSSSLSGDWPVDGELVAAATASVQAQERLSSLLRSRAENKPAVQKVADDSVTILDSLRDLKSRVEGTQFIFSPFSLDNNQLSLLRHLVVSHTPSNLHEGTKAKIAEKIMEIFDGQVKRLVYATILTCPWYSGSQSEESSQAKNNVLYVVFVSRDEQFFTLATQHEKELCETIDQGVIFACEVRHFCAQLQRGNVRAVEALCSPPDSIIFSSPEWISLASLLDPVSLLTRTFVDRCVGQSVGALVKKRPASGRLVVRDDALLSKFCDSFRLLSYAESAIKREPISSWFDVGVNQEEKDILQSLTKAFEGLVQKEQLLEHVLKVKKRVNERLEIVPTVQPEWTTQLGEWLTKMRMEGVKLSLPLELESDLDPHRDFLDSQSLTSIHSRDVIVIAKAGSQMYNLALPTSDTDYIVVYRKPTQAIISSSFNHKESMDNHGHQADTEIAAYEIRLFCEMLLKGAVNMFELLFADNLYYTSNYWSQLSSLRKSFMSEKVILQYIGFIKTHMKLINSGKHTGTPRERKLFYQVFHKLLSLESFVVGGNPVVTCTGTDRDYLMKIRRGPLEGDLDRALLYSEAQRRLGLAREQLLGRVKRFQEYGDYRILQTWLLLVRGISLKEPLKMVTPPI